MANNIKTRTKLTLRAKVDIIEFLTKGNRQVDAHKHFNLDRATISAIWKNKESSSTSSRIKIITQDRRGKESRVETKPSGRDSYDVLCMKSGQARNHTQMF